MSDALDKLIEAVEGGVRIDDTSAVGECNYEAQVHMLNAYNGSLDAAKALHEALLPGWDIQICTYEDDSFEASVAKPLCVKSFDSVNHYMARAWLLAILKAYRSTK